LRETMRNRVPSGWTPRRYARARSTSHGCAARNLWRSALDWARESPQSSPKAASGRRRPAHFRHGATAPFPVSHSPAVCIASTAIPE